MKVSALLLLLFTSVCYGKACDRIAEWSSVTDGQKFIVGGVPSLEAEFPHMAALGFSKPINITWKCGGSLIAKKFVLTAAHCTFNFHLGHVSIVRLGVINLKNPTQNGSPQDFKVRRTILYPYYKPSQLYHDIALIELDRPADINKFVMPACMQTAKQIGNPFWSATGWGTTTWDGPSSNTLQKVNLKEYGVQKCAQRYSKIDEMGKAKLPIGIEDASQICAGELNKDTCKQDSGGPLQYKTVGKKAYTIIGVTAFGFQLCGSGNPGVYLRVSYYIDWIAATVWP